MAKKIPIVLTPCPPSKACPICHARMNHSEKYYGKPTPEATKTEELENAEAFHG